MSRVNIDDSLFRDKRFIKLCLKLGDPEKALGKFVFAVFLGQKYWAENEKKIPFEAFENEDNQSLLEVNLAKKYEDGYYIRGAKDYFSWLLDKRESGRIGGRISAQRDRSKLGQLLPKDAQAENTEVIENIGELSKQSQAKPSKAKQSQADQASSSSSSSSSLEKNKNMSESKMNSDYLDLFEKLWTLYPRKDGKKEALRHFKSSVNTKKDEDDIIKALHNYLISIAENNTEIKYIKNGKTWFNNWRDWLGVIEFFSK